MTRALFFILGLGTLWSGCTLMPKYERPPTPVSKSWPNGPAGTNATNAAAADIDWKEFFDDPRLQNLIRLALQNNRDLRTLAPFVAGEIFFQRLRFQTSHPAKEIGLVGCANLDGVCRDDAASLESGNRARKFLAD